MKKLIRATYLDTYSIRSAGRKLSSINGLGRCFTSAFTLVELLNGIRRNSDEFKKRSAALRHVINSGLKVDWTMPEGRMAGAFQNLTCSEKRIKCLKSIVATTKSSTDLTAFCKQVEALGLEYPLDFFEEYDTYFGKAYIKHTQEEHPKLRKDYLAWRKSILGLGVRQDILPGSYKKFVTPLQDEQWFMDALENATILNLVMELLNSLDFPLSQNQIINTCSQYNGSINTFIKADCVKAIDGLAASNPAGRNDAADMAHFLYVKHFTTIVTEDTGMKKTAVAAGLTTCSMKELLSDCSSHS